MRDLEAPKDYAVVPKDELVKILEMDRMFFFGKRNQNRLDNTLTVYMNEKMYCKCKDIDEALQVINYYF